ncbi:hypothetical protein AN958_10403 [Leucoagaricus sp. SymC.cos]|nr:hypothetical protein AN958_10403 [Leucoagaricus sp. SymC.cos]
MSSNSNAQLVHSTEEFKKTMKEYTPDLMPFHIGYDGPAPVSTYMKIETVKRGVGMPETENADGEGEGKGKELDIEMKDNKSEANVDERYTSTFRGRTLHGMRVALPDGYSGLVLRSKDGSSSSLRMGEEAEDEAKGRRLRSKKTAMGSAETRDGVKAVVVGERFSGLRVWHADMAVDGGRDEYVRGLAEWTALASEVSGVG